MKKLLPGLAAALLFAGCQPDGPIQLGFQLPEGKTVRYTTEAQQTIDQTVMGQTLSVKQSTGFDMLYKVTAVNGNSRDVDVTYDRVRLSTNATGKELKWDSRDTAGNDPAFAVMGAMTGKSFQITVARDGQIERVTGFTELLNGLIGDPTDPTAALMRQQLEPLFSDAAVRQTLEQNTHIYPDQPVKKGDTWERTMTSSMGPIVLTIHNTYRLEKATSTHATVSVKGDITGATGATPVEGMQVHLKGTQTGTLNMEIATGMVEKMNYTQNIDGAMEIQNMKVPMKIQTTGTVSGSGVK